MKSRHASRAHSQTMSSPSKYIFLFYEKGDNYCPYSSGTKKWWKYCWQHRVPVHKVIIGGTLNVLNDVEW
jgi:hypothetical protein